MRIITLYLLFFIPVFAFGQLFPNVPEFRGNIKKVVEKRYGKEFNPWRKDSVSYNPGVYSGLKYIYLFDKKSKLSKRINTFQGKIQTETDYKTTKTAASLVKTEVTRKRVSGGKESVVEYENFFDASGRIVKVNSSTKNQATGVSELFLLEDNALYDQKKLTSFTRHILDPYGKTISVEECKLQYNSTGRLIRIDRRDVSSGFTTSIQYNYNIRGLVDHSSIDFLSEVQEYGKTQILDVYYKYDRRGNWTRMYRKSVKKNQLEARRKIFYQ
jgi:hypothetical protein